MHKPKHLTILLRIQLTGKDEKDEKKKHCDLCVYVWIYEKIALFRAVNTDLKKKDDDDDNKENTTKARSNIYFQSHRITKQSSSNQSKPMNSIMCIELHSWILKYTVCVFSSTQKSRLSPLRPRVVFVLFFFFFSTVINSGYTKQYEILIYNVHDIH